MQYDLKPIRSAVLSIYKEISAICDKHGLRYFAFYGTLLGAVRHKGFIPWDDDMDIAMPRPDYNKFMYYARSELPGHLRWESVESSPDYLMSFAKISDTRAYNVALVQKESCLKLEQGLFVDIFPLDGLPSNRLCLFFWKVKRALFRRAIMHTMCSSVLQRFFRISGCNDSQKRLMFNQWLSKRPFDTSKYVGFANESSTNIRRFQMRNEWFSHNKTLSFERGTIPVPIGWKDILVALFGDWERLPPRRKKGSNAPNGQAIR